MSVLLVLVIHACTKHGITDCFDAIWSWSRPVCTVYTYRGGGGCHTKVERKRGIKEDRISRCQHDGRKKSWNWCVPGDVSSAGARFLRTSPPKEYEKIRKMCSIHAETITIISIIDNGRCDVAGTISLSLLFLTLRSYPTTMYGQILRSNGQITANRRNTNVLKPSCVGTSGVRQIRVLALSSLRPLWKNMAKDGSSQTTKTPAKWGFSFISNTFCAASQTTPFIVVFITI